MECLIVVKIEIYQRAITNLPILSDIPLVSTNFKWYSFSKWYFFKDRKWMK